jgi:hypothetical protein
MCEGQFMGFRRYRGPSGSTIAGNMTARVEVLAHKVSRPHVLVAVAGLDLTHVGFHDAPQDLSARQEEGYARADLLGAEDEEPKLLANPPVVALSGLLEPLQIGLELFLRLPRRAVDAREHLVLLAAAPIGSRDIE